MANMTEAEAARLGAQVRVFMEQVERDEALLDRFSSDPVTTLKNNGIEIPADRAAPLEADLAPYLGALPDEMVGSAFGCWSCKAGLTIVLGVVLGAALAVIAAAVAAFFNVAAAVAAPWISAAWDIGVVGATALAAYCCYKAKACSSYAVAPSTG